MNAPTPSPGLPHWAREFFDGWRAQSGYFVSIDEEMEHRREAFYRLYTADDADVRAMWKYVETSIDPEFRAGFLSRLVLATDEIIPDTPLPVYGAPDYAPPRLRTREQRRARKLAEQLRLLNTVTPPRCKAYNSRVNHAASDIELLIIWFDISQVPHNPDRRWQLTELRIEYTRDSKRGWKQHRRASDILRQKVIKTARELAGLPGAKKRAAWLHTLAEDLAALPEMKDEHAADIALLGQKADYTDWVRVIHAEMDDYAASPLTPALRHRDLATLANVITATPADDQMITEDDVAHAISTTAAAGFLNNPHRQ